MMKKTVQPREIAARKVAPMFVKPKSIYAEEKSKSEPAPPPVPVDPDFWGLKLKMPEGGTVILRKKGSPNAVSLEVSIDGTNWQPWELVGTDYSYTLQAGETLCIRNTSETFEGPSASSTAYWNFVFDSATYASGSIMSMATQDSTIVDMSGGTACFARLFEGCTSLLTAPTLPALSLAENCYRGLFRNTSIKEAPELPATTLAKDCYTAMYRECTLLERAPILPAAVLAQSSYAAIFYGCSSLNYIYTMMTDITATQCIANWTNGVAATGDFYCPSSLTIPSGASGIPNGWTRHDI